MSMMTADELLFLKLWMTLFPIGILCLQYGIDMLIEDLTPMAKKYQPREEED